MSSDPPEQPWFFLNRQRKVRFDETEILRFLERVGRDLVRGAEFAVVVGSGASLREANRRFRGVSRTTDVLSFADGENDRLGDLLISASRALRQAERYGHAIEDELKILILHGLLHLRGFDHGGGERRMRRAEQRLRKKYGLPPGLIERAAVS